MDTSVAAHNLCRVFFSGCRLRYAYVRKSFGAWWCEKNVVAISANRRMFSEMYYGFLETLRFDNIVRVCPRSYLL